MKTKIRVLFAATLCSVAAAGISVADAQETSKSNVYKLVQGFPEIFLDSRVKNAESNLTRYDDKVCFSVDTNSLPAGAYTVWLRSFTDPATTCSDGERIGGPTGNVVEGSQCSRRDIGPSGCIFSGQWRRGARSPPTRAGTAARTRSSTRWSSAPARGASPR